MLTNGYITLWHEKKPGFYRAHIYNNLRVAAENGGAVYQNEMTVRIPTKVKIAVKCGDWIAEGIHSDEAKDKRRKIVSVTENLYGMNPHYKVIAV